VYRACTPIDDEEAVAASWLRVAPRFHHAGFVKASCFSHEKWC
jgi:hypothetical protein